MKKRIITLCAMLCTVLLTFVCLTSCGGDSSGGPSKLNAPTVTLVGNVASWQTDSNADKFELSLNGNLSYVENSVTSKALSDGETLKVRAVGDGATFSTSDWSNSVTYTKPEPSPNATKLATPTVTVSKTGLAAWDSVSGASGYVYKINGGAETATSNTTVQLANGQSIVVKAVGDGTNYTDSDYSLSRTYTSNPSASSGEPAYLGIFASITQPTVGDGLPEALIPSNVVRSSGGISREWRDFGTALEEYFEDGDNHLGTKLPTASDYDFYTIPNGLFYVQIWLNNPEQHTILSLKLNGTKYQVGGAASSFFIEEGGEHYNCIYVALSIPADAHTELSYTVTDIEYIADTYINADGTDEFMNNNDTVTIGLPYKASRPTVSQYNLSLPTHNSVSAEFSVSDNGGMLDLCGGWLGVAVYDGNMKFEIVANKAVTVGNNSINVSGLVEDSHYRVIIYLYADLHDGNGVRAHTLYEDWITTEKAIEVIEIESTTVMNDKNTGYVGAITVETELKSQTASYVKLEILNEDEEVVYTDADFDGSAVVTDGILNNAFYTVRVYYKDNEYPDGKYVEETCKVMELRELWLGEHDAYTFVNDAIYRFEFETDEENYPAPEGFVIRFFDSDSAQFIAEDVLTLISNENIIGELWDEWYSLRDEASNYEYESPEQIAINAQMHAIYDRINELERAKNTWENDFDSDSDTAFWEAEKLKGRYYYEYAYSGTDTENVIKVDGSYYVILRDVMENCGGRYEVQVVAMLDKNEGNGLYEKVYDARNIDLRTMFYEEIYGVYETAGIKNTALNGEEFTFTLYNTHDTKLEAEESNKNRMFVYKITASNGTVLYLNETALTPEIDEDEWMEQYISALKAGTLDAKALYNTYVPDHPASQTVTLDLSELDAGKYNFYVYFRTYDKAYEEDDCEDSLAVDNLGVYKKFESPSLRINGCYAYVGIPSVASEYDIVIEAYDKNGDPIEITDIYYEEWNGEETIYRFEFAYPGAKVRVKLSKYVFGDEEAYWIDSDPTAYLDSQAQALAAPTFTKEGSYLSWNTDSPYVDGYVYTVNGGDEQHGSSLYLGPSCTVKVKAIASAYGKENGYCDSEWATYTYTRPTGGAGKG